MASLSGAAARGTTAGADATAMQRCFVPRLPQRGITAQAASSASGPLRKAAQRSDSSVRSPVAVASSKDKDSQAASKAGPAPAVRAAQQAPFWRRAARPLLLLLPCWLLLLLTQTWSVNLAVLLALLAGMFLSMSYTKKMLDLAIHQYIELLLRDKQPATPTAELARKFQCLKLDAKMYMLRLLLVGLAVAGALLVADVLSRALLGHGLAHYLLPPVLTPSYPSDPEWSLPPWAPLAIPFLHLAGMAARKAREACRARRLFWAAAAARRQANAARLNTKRTGAQQPSTQP